VDDLFGENTTQLRKVIPEALREAHVRARRGHDAAQLATLEVYGHGLACAQFEELARRIGGLDRARLAKLYRYWVAVLDGCVVYPIRYADDSVTEPTAARVRRPVSGLRRRLFTAHGPDPLQPSLDESLDLPTTDDLRAAFPQLGEDTRLIVVAYACNVDGGVLRAAWGEAELHTDDGSLTWHRLEPLRLPEQEVAEDTRPSAPVTVGGGISAAGPSSVSRRFDEAPEPSPVLAPRTNLSPSSEPQPTPPIASDEDADS